MSFSNSVTIHSIEIEEIKEQNNLKKINWAQSVPFILLHVAALVGLFYFKPNKTLILLCIGSYYLRMFAITAGYHRYFAHRSFKTSRLFQFFLAFLGTTATQKGVLWWASHHRHHHRYSDQENDVHSPVKDTFLWSHVLWILSSKWNETDHNQVRDFKQFKELQFLNNHFFIPVIIYSAILYCMGGIQFFFWGYVVSTVLLWHGTFLVNSVAHLWGSKRYKSGDDSRNNLFIALLTLGEGWHNNHHFYMSSTRQGFFWWEIDISYLILKVLSSFGIVWDIREPPEKIKYAHLSLS